MIRTLPPRRYRDRLWHANRSYVLKARSPMPEISVEDAVKQNCQAVLAGDLMRIMADLTPEALGALMANAGSNMGGAMPALTSFDIQSHDVSGDDHVFKIQFKGDADFMATATWKDVAGAWKITNLEMAQ
jgi:hypothetical protein